MLRWGGANAFGHDVNEAETLLLAGTVFVVSLLLVVVYKLARGWDDDDKGASILPLHSRRRQLQLSKLGTIREDEVVTFDWKMR